jgi:multicomponent Na+:H+ antiporter subunit D
MVLFAALCLLLGVFPGWLYALLPYPVDYVPYTADHLVSQFQLLLFAGLAFFVMLPAMRRTLTLSLDTDWFYRRLGPALWRGVIAVGTGIGEALGRAVLGPLRRLLALVMRPHGPEGILARTWPTGSMLLWVAVMLLLLLVVGAVLPR